MAREKFQVRVTQTTQRDALDSDSYTELAISVTENGYQWDTLRVPAEMWPVVELAVMERLAGNFIDRS